MNPWDLPRDNPGDYEDWKYEVASGDTLRGFADWLLNREPEA